MELEQALDGIHNIIALEQRDISGNALYIDRISMDIIAQINLSGLYIDRVLYQFLEDFDIRRKDDRYRVFQTDRVIQFMTHDVRLRQPDA